MLHYRGLGLLIFTNKYTTETELKVQAIKYRGFLDSYLFRRFRFLVTVIHSCTAKVKLEEGIIFLNHADNTTTHSVMQRIRRVARKSFGEN